LQSSDSAAQGNNSRTRSPRVQAALYERARTHTHHCGPPRNAARSAEPDDIVGEVGVETHAWRQRKRQVGSKAHQQTANEGRNSGNGDKLATEVFDALVVLIVIEAAGKIISRCLGALAGPAALAEQARVHCATGTAGRAVRRSVPAQPRAASARLARAHGARAQREASGSRPEASTARAEQRRTRRATCKDVAQREEGRGGRAQLSAERRAALGELEVVVDRGRKRHACRVTARAQRQNLVDSPVARLGPQRGRALDAREGGCRSARATGTARPHLGHSQSLHLPAPPARRSGACCERQIGDRGSVSKFGSRLMRKSLWSSYGNQASVTLGRDSFSKPSEARVQRFVPFRTNLEMAYSTVPRAPARSPRTRSCA